MIPHIIHYCWFGGSEMPQVAKNCIESWHKYMPSWEYMLWNEDNFDVNICPYTREAYQSKKYAFVSDYVRLWALNQYGGIYLDTDVEVFRALDPLLDNRAFAGFEGSKHKPIGTCILASVSHGQWISEQLGEYQDRHFMSDDGVLDMTTNVQFMTSRMIQKGFISNGKEQDYLDLHVYPVDYFSPRHTTGEYVRTSNTFCEHKGLASWSNERGGWKMGVRRIVGPQVMTKLIKLKRSLLG